ncbi:hypothetical protein MTO96_028097 [Rhipicephalus appendiculatus]
MRRWKERLSRRLALKSMNIEARQRRRLDEEADWVVDNVVGLYGRGYSYELRPVVAAPSQGQAEKMVQASESEVVQVDGEELSPTEFGKEQGWYEIKRNTKKVAGDADPVTNQQATPASSKKETFIQKATQHVRKFTMASRMPNLPTDDYKIIVRPRDGFNVSHYQKDRVHCCIRNAAGVEREVAEEDRVCLNE